MARGDSLFCRLELDFILMDDRWLDLSGPCAKLYVTLWCLSVHERSECLPKRYTPVRVARRSGIDPRTVAQALTTLQQECLISINDEGRIIVEGVRVKHKRLNGWIKEDGSPYGDSTLPIAGESKRERKIKRKSNPPLPPTGVRGLSADQKVKQQEDFEEFWKACTWRKGSVKSTTRDRWIRLVKSDPIASVEDLLKAAKNYQSHIEQTGSEVLMATTFLGRERRWEAWINPEGADGKRDPRPLAAQGKYLSPGASKYDGIGITVRSPGQQSKEVRDDGDT